MSYARMGKDNDIYLMQDMEGAWNCVNCLLNPYQQTEVLDFTHEVIVHLSAHIKAGHKVPSALKVYLLWLAESNKIKLNGKQVDIITLKSSTAECEKCNQDANYLIVEPDYTVWYWCGRCSEEK